MIAMSPPWELWAQHKDNLPLLVSSLLLLPICLIAGAVFLWRHHRRGHLMAGCEDRVYPVILGLATGNPKYQVSQKEALELAMRVPECDGVRGNLGRIYANTRIQYRHMAVPDFTPKQAEKDDPCFFPTDLSFRVPVEVRLMKFREKAVPLVTEVCRQAIERAGVAPERISKLVMVSSTGFLGPGLDCALIQELGLRRDMDRSLIGFMGCAAAMNGFRICNDYVRVNPGKLALLCCVELSSVHTTFDDDANDAILHAIFADGCAAAVLEGQRPCHMRPGTLAIYDDHAFLMPQTEDGITLSVNANGISCTLSRRLPEYIRLNIRQYVGSFLDKHGMCQEDVDFWGVHPGGTRIIEEVQNGLGLTPTQTADSWAVLAKYGNMLSPSIMFVLERVFARHEKMLAEGQEGYHLGLAFSFSPGVGVEGIMLRQVVA